jgi:release factor glutamine methyltransferase
MNFPCKMNRSDCQSRNNTAGSLMLGDWLGKAAQALHSLPDEPAASVCALAASVLGKQGYWPQAHPEFQLNQAQREILDDKFTQLLSGEPLPYLTENQAFYGLDFYVNPDVLIPRPETEILVEAALGWLGKFSGPCLAADAGTGSGCIAIAISKNTPQTHFLASDISFSSLQVAKRNCLTYQLHERIDLLQCDLLGRLQTRFDLICANLPYIPSAKLANLEVARHEPLTALDGGRDGLDLIIRLLEQAQQLINTPGLILLEIEFSQAAAIESIIRCYFPQAGITISHDLNHLPRLVKIETGMLK